MSVSPPTEAGTVYNEKKNKDELELISMAELLRRLSEAAFFVYEAEYRTKGIESPEQVLRPPLTATEITRKEEELGPLPADVKEMSLIADGFYGGWHFAAGGWGGIAGLSTENANAHETHLHYFPEPTKMRIEREDGSTQEWGVSTSNSGIDWGQLYVSWGATENDDYIHVLCPHQVWKKMRNAMGREVKDAEYAVVQYAPWDVGMKPMPSMRAWIIDLTLWLEGLVATNTKESYE